MGLVILLACGLVASSGRMALTPDQLVGAAVRYQRIRLYAKQYMALYADRARQHAGHLLCVGSPGPPANERSPPSSATCCGSGTNRWPRLRWPQRHRTQQGQSPRSLLATGPARTPYVGLSAPASRRPRVGGRLCRALLAAPSRGKSLVRPSWSLVGAATVDDVPAT